MDFTGSNDIGTLALGLVIAGAVAGFMTGTIGAGGGLVLVPSLYLVLTALGVSEALRMHVAVGTALACLLPTALAVLAAGNAKPGWPGMKANGVALFAGAAAGGAIGAWLDGHLLTLCFIVLALASAAFMALAKENAPSGTGRRSARLAAAFDLGVLATLSGIGPDRQALRYSGQDAGAPAYTAGLALIGVAIAMFAGWERPGLPEHSLGYVNAQAVAVIILPMLGGALAGRHFADLVEAKRLRVTFAMFVAVIAAKMLWDVWG